MIAVALMQAGVPVIEDLTRQARIANTNLPQVLILLGAVAVVVILLIVWAVFIRKRAHRRRHHHHHWKTREVSGPSENGSSARGARSRRKRSRSAERPRNPTLAETRGLPPVRGEEPPPPTY